MKLTERGPVKWQCLLCLWPFKLGVTGSAYLIRTAQCNFCVPKYSCITAYTDYILAQGLGVCIWVSQYDCAHHKLPAPKSHEYIYCMKCFLRCLEKISAFACALKRVSTVCSKSYQCVILLPESFAKLNLCSQSEASRTSMFVPITAPNLRDAPHITKAPKQCPITSASCGLHD